jgi:hypothetical protein
LGYGLYRALQACGVRCYVCAPDSSEQKKKRRKNNTIDTRTLTSNLFNYLNGNERALQKKAPENRRLFQSGRKITDRNT